MPLAIAAIVASDVARARRASHIRRRRVYSSGAIPTTSLNRAQGSGHVINTASTAGLLTKPAMAVSSATKVAVRAISEGLRQEAGANLRVTVVTPGFVHTNLADSMTDATAGARIRETMQNMAIPPDAIARAVAFAVDSPQPSMSARSSSARPPRLDAVRPVVVWARARRRPRVVKR